MPKIYRYLMTSIGIAACWVNGTQQAHGQLSQVLNDYRNDRPFQYAPGDPWTRSKLFNKQTKHYGLGYNCDGEESKRNSPYINWKTHTERDLPSRIRWWQRLNHTAAEVKLRIADGSCIQCAQANPCQHCQQSKCGECCDCQSSIGVEMAANELANNSNNNSNNNNSNNNNRNITQESVFPRPPYEATDVASTKTSQPILKQTSLLPESKSTRRASAPVRVAGLESLDIRVK